MTKEERERTAKLTWIKEYFMEYEKSGGGKRVLAAKSKQQANAGCVHPNCFTLR